MSFTRYLTTGLSPPRATNSSHSIVMVAGQFTRWPGTICSSLTGSSPSQVITILMRLTRTSLGSGRKLPLTKASQRFTRPFFALISIFSVLQRLPSNSKTRYQACTVPIMKRFCCRINMRTMVKWITRGTSSLTPAKAWPQKLVRQIATQVICKKILTNLL